jgi:hypothetical protein
MFHICFIYTLVSAGMDLMANRGPNVTRCELASFDFLGHGLKVVFRRWWNEIVSRPSWVRLQTEGIKSWGI